jgi:hypothetical protein
MSDGAVFLWIRNTHESVTWLLCSKHLPISRDVAKYLLKFLFDKRYLFDLDLGITWNPLQLDSARSLLEHNYTLVDTPRRIGSIYCAMGIVATFLLRERNYTILVYCSESGLAEKFTSRVHEMIANRCKNVYTTNTHLSLPDFKSELIVSENLHGPIPSCSLVIMIDALDPAQFFKFIVPLMSVRHSKLLWFGDSEQSPWYEKMLELRLERAQFVFNVIRDEGLAINQT